jgi:hypothetical protein
MVKTLVAQPYCDVHRTNPGVAEDDQVFVRIKLLMSASRHLAHGHWNGALNVGRSHLPRFTHVDKSCLPVVQQSGGVDRRNLVVEHGMSLMGAGYPLKMRANAREMPPLQSIA